MEDSGVRRFLNNRTLSLAAMALIAAAASVACYRTGYVVFLFLLPLGLCAFFGGAKTAWAAGILAASLNWIVSLWFYIYRGEEPGLLRWIDLYYSATVLVFTWINVPLGRFWVLKEIPYRMVAGAAFCTLLFSPLFLFMIRDPELYHLMARRFESLGSLTSSGPTAEELLSISVYFALRGGIFFSCLVFWWINRQFALLLTRLFMAAKKGGQAGQAGTLMTFRAPFFLVWVISFSLGAILLGRTGAIEILEIGGWNILVLSATLFLVQGGAVALFFLARLPPLLRIFVNMGILILFFRPEIGAVILGVLVLLGIAEHWVPFRAPKQ